MTTDNEYTHADHARADHDQHQLSLFPTRVDQVLESVGVTIAEARRLFDRDWLSFDVVAEAELSPAEEAELRFLSCLVAAGCDDVMLGRLLGGLRRPFAYDLSRMFYNWSRRRWEVPPPEPEANDVIQAHLGEAIADRDPLAIKAVIDMASQAMADLVHELAEGFEDGSD